MSAPKRTRQQKAVWLKPDEIPEPSASFRKDVLDYPKADEALARITRPGLTEELVWRILWELACVADESKVHVDRWHSLPGFELRTLRRFPDRVRSWADEVELIGSRIRSDEAYGHLARFLPLFLELEVGTTKIAELGTGKQVIPDALARSILKRRAELPKCAELPSLLRFYANYIETVCKLTTHHAPKTPSRFRENLEFAFIEYVRRMTGKHRFPEIATLLTAAYSAKRGQGDAQAGSSKIVDAHNLGMQYRRHTRGKQ